MNDTLNGWAEHKCCQTTTHCAFQAAGEGYRQCLSTLILVCICVCVSHHHGRFVCLELLSPLHSCARTLMVVDSTSVKASKCGQLKSHSARKDGWMLLVQKRGLLFSSSHFLFLRNGSGCKEGSTGHFTSRAIPQLTEDRHAYTVCTHRHTCIPGFAFSCSFFPVYHFKRICGSK